MPLISGLNYVESNITQEILQLETPDNTANATLVIGTSRKGKTGTLTKIDTGDVRTRFGEVPQGSDFETNIPHAALAIQASTAARDKEMYVYKVGDSSAAKLELYENQVFLTGDLSYSVDSDGNPLVGMVFTAREENEEDNSTSVVVRGDDSGLPTSMVITLPDGYTRVFSMDPYGVRPGIPANVADLVDEINEDTAIADRLEVEFNVLRKSNLEVTVQSGSNNYIEVGPSPASANESWGDKLVNIEEVKEELTHTETLDASKIAQKLTYDPNKDDDPFTVTIDSFVKIVTDEQLIEATASDVGQTSLQKALAITSPSFGWDQDDNSVTDLDVRFVRGGAVTQIDSSDYSLTSGVLDITTLPFSMQIGDKVIVSYKFGAVLVEANTRSELVTGNENSYFIKGSEIIFGAAPSLPLEVTYDATKVFLPSDLNIASREDITIEFINPNNAPDAGASVFITFTYLPELPAVSGSTVSGATVTVVQGSALKGGTAGSLITKQRYRELVEQALDDTMFVPFRRVIVAGSYLDDFVPGINDETGLPGTVNLGWGDLLATKLARKSRVASECHTVLGVKPISLQRLNSGQAGINEWIEELLDTTDETFTPAAQIAALNSYHVDIALGVPYVSDASILSGAGYVENPAYVMTGMQLDRDLTESLIKSPVPIFVKRLLVQFNSGELVGRLNNAHYTTFVVNSKNQMRVADAPTSADSRTSLARQIVRDTTFATLRIARDIAEDFIGRRRDAKTLNLMQSKINRDVNRAMVNQEPQYLSFFNAEIVPTNGGHITGETRMRVALETSREIGPVVLTTTVKLGGEGL